LGWALSETEAMQITVEMDWNSTGFVEFASFAGWIIRQEEENNHDIDPDALVHSAFHHIDNDNSGSITTSELLAALQELGEDDLEFDDVQQIVHEADEDDDGQIDIHEFSALLKRVMTQG